LDKADQVAVIEEKLSYLLLALENYAKALIKSDKHDLKMYRWISLWFANTEEKRVNQMVETFVQTIPDHKFVGLLYQLCARMVTNKDSKFPIILKYIIQKCAKKHPYHTLPIILALANSDADEKVSIFFIFFFFNVQFYYIFPFFTHFLGSRTKKQAETFNC
jgi:ataxia telangiectasia mutated family protein